MTKTRNFVWDLTKAEVDAMTRVRLLGYLAQQTEAEIIRDVLRKIELFDSTGSVILPSEWMATQKFIESDMELFQTFLAFRAAAARAMAPDEEE